jgi:hypothetical protein
MADELTAWSLAAETTEFVGPITVTADGVPVTGFEVTLTGPGARPATWVSPEVLGSQRGILVGTGTGFPLVPSTKYTVWVRYADSPETPVMHVGTIRAY